MYKKKAPSNTPSTSNPKSHLLSGQDPVRGCLLLCPWALPMVRSNLDISNPHPFDGFPGGTKCEKHTKKNMKKNLLSTHGRGGKTCSPRLSVHDSSGRILGSQQARGRESDRWLSPAVTWFRIPFFVHKCPYLCLFFVIRQIPFPWYLFSYNYPLY